MANNYFRTVLAIDIRSKTVVATIPVDAEPETLAVDPSNHQVWVAGNGSASVIDPGTFMVSATIPLSAEPRGIVVDPETQTTYITKFNVSSIMTVDTATHAVGNISLQREAGYAVAIDPAVHSLFHDFGLRQRHDDRHQDAHRHRLPPRREVISLRRPLYLGDRGGPHNPRGLCDVRRILQHH
ncbi:YncE family protein [Nocardia sp. NPDC004860]|uniref:YncE family protein n=1 Tax=Nocardia sp. NPDC004860 TaxID=3154557 RepID=UPI0033A67B98